MTLGPRNFIGVAPDQWHFKELLSGSIFVPMGCNYFPQGVGWAPKLWSQFKPETMAEDFAVMQEMGMNLIRVFLSLKPFLPEEKCLSQEYMAKCERMLCMAGEHDLRIVFSGPSAWEGTPPWAQALQRDWHEYFTDEQVLENLDYFWEQFGRQFGDHSAVFGYDLFNEPYMVWDLPSRLAQWVAFLKEKYGSIAELNASWPAAQVSSWDEISIPPNESNPNNQVIWDYQLFKNELSRRFIAHCVAAIRRYDKNHLITIGTHPGTVPFDGSSPGRYFGFDPHFVGDLLDYVSLHFYPYNDSMDIPDHPDNFEKNLALLFSSMKYMNIGKPLILEEFGLYGGGSAPSFPWRKPFPYVSQETQADWVLGVMERSKGFCSGWLNWGFRDYPQAKDPTRFQGFFDDDGRRKLVGQRFPSTANRVRLWVASHDRQAGTKNIPLPLKELVTDGKQAAKFRNQMINLFKESTDWEFSLSDA